MKQRLLNGELIEFMDEEKQVQVLLWFQKKTSNFCIQLNGKIIKSTKTFKPVEKKLKSIPNLIEVIEKKKLIFSTILRIETNKNTR